MPAERGPEEGPRLVCAATQHVTVDDRNYLHETWAGGMPLGPAPHPLWKVNGGLEESPPQ